MVRSIFTSPFWIWITQNYLKLTFCLLNLTWYTGRWMLHCPVCYFLDSIPAHFWGSQRRWRHGWDWAERRTLRGTTPYFHFNRKQPDHLTVCYGIIYNSEITQVTQLYFSLSNVLITNLNYSFTWQTSKTITQWTYKVQSLFTVTQLWQPCVYW